MRVVALILLTLLMVQPVAAQAEGFLRLGTDPQGDARVQGQGHPDTIFDILTLDVMTEGEELVFFLGLRGDTTEIGSACPVVAFQVGGNEYLAFDCFECVAYECTNAASDLEEPGSTRGTKVGTTALGGGGATMRVPFSDIGVSVGDRIEDIYALTYQSRILTVVDAAPDAKGGDRNSGDNFGFYVVGADFLGEPPLEEIVEAVGTIYEDLAEPIVQHSFENATSDVYQFNFTSETGFGLVDLDVNGTGFANATLVDGNGTELFNGTLASGVTEYQNFTAGAWTLVIAYDGFVGNMSFQFLDGQSVQNDAEETVEETPTTDDNSTEEDLAGAEDDAKESPGAPMVALMAALAAVVLVRRRK